jgi:hypothetical protein
MEIQKRLLFRRSPRMQLTFQIGQDPRHLVHGILQEVQNFTLDRGKVFRNVHRVKQDAYLRVNEYTNPLDYERLSRLASRFLKASFNPLMAAVRRDFEKQDRSVLESDYLIYFWITQFFLDFQRRYFEQFHHRSTNHVTEQENPHEIGRLADDSLPFELVAEVLDISTFQFIMKISRGYMENRQWAVLHVSICALRRILTSLDYMVDSKRIEWVEFGTHIQNNIFYDGNCFEFLRQLLHDFNLQSRGFLVDLVFAVHILLRSLEHYLQRKPVLFVKRKKRKAKTLSSLSTGLEERTHESDGTDESNDDLSSEEEDERHGGADQTEQTVDREFRLETYEMSFASEAILHSYCILLKDFRSNEVILNHCIAKMFHRIFINCKLEALFYKLSILVLFHKLLQSKIPDEGHRGPDNCHELRRFAKLVCRRFFKRVVEYPPLLLEILFPKRRSDCYYIQFGEEYHHRHKHHTSAEEEHTHSPLTSVVPPSESDSEEGTNEPANVDFNQFKKLRTRWSAKHIEKLRNLHQQYGSTPEGIQTIVHELGNRTIENVQRQLIKMKLVPKPPKRKIPRPIVHHSSSTSDSELSNPESDQSDHSDLSDREAIRKEIELLRKRIHLEAEPTKNPLEKPLSEDHTISISFSVPDHPKVSEFPSVVASQQTEVHLTLP